MKAQLRLAYRYIRWYYHASNGLGHGVHSPFVYRFIREVLLDEAGKEQFKNIEGLRKELKKRRAKIKVEDFGAGSSVIKSKEREIGIIASSSLKPQKYSFLLYKIARFFKPRTVLELGTSFGMTTSYLAKAGPTASIYTLEGSPEIASIARQNFKRLSLTNITLVEGDFANTFAGLLSQLQTVDLAFVDGNHQKGPTIRYFTELLKKKNEESVFVFDDIYWSEGMEEAWAVIKEHPEVSLTIDLFFVGIVFFKRGFKEKQHFKIRF